MSSHRSARAVAASAVVVVALVVLLDAVGTATLTYTLPPAPGSSVPNRHTTVWGPGVAASALAALAVAASSGWLVWNLRRRPPARCWWVVGGLLLVAVVVTLVAGGLSRPTF